MVTINKAVVLSICEMKRKEGRAPLSALMHRCDSLGCGVWVQKLAAIGDSPRGAAHAKIPEGLCGQRARKTHEQSENQPVKPQGVAQAP
ncbi:MAG: hypothetical protein NW206_04755 [Hyphomonadaceae bacterium]|nr:hypothetical protein [Hyphomonadaceae bacterium]